MRVPRVNGADVVLLFAELAAHAIARGCVCGGCGANLRILPPHPDFTPSGAKCFEGSELEACQSFRKPINAAIFLLTGWCSLCQKKRRKDGDAVAQLKASAPYPLRLALESIGRQEQLEDAEKKEREMDPSPSLEELFRALVSAGEPSKGASNGHPKLTDIDEPFSQEIAPGITATLLPPDDHVRPERN